MVPVRDLVKEDYAQCIALWARVGMPAEPHLERRLDMLLTRNVGLSLVVEVEQQFVGCVLASFNGFSGYIFRLAVAPTQQGRGIGSALLAACEQRLARVGAVKVTIACEASLTRFYEQRGYARTRAELMLKEIDGDSA